MRFLRWLIIWTVLGITSGTGWATDLLPGEVAFTSINADGNKRFSFVLLTDISDTTSIYFTDNGWSSSTTSWSNTSEGTLLWTYDGSLACGTEVRVDPTQDTVSLGVLSTPDLGFNVSTSGDGILAYTGTGVGSVTNFIAAIDQSGLGWLSSPSGSGQTGLPAELSNGSSAVALTPHRDNWRYDCTVQGGVISGLESALNNVSNWNSNDDTELIASSCIAGCATDSTIASANGAGNGLRFDGFNDHVGLPKWLNPALTDFTIECWFNLNSVSTKAPLVQQLNGPGTGETYLYVQGGRLRTDLGGSALIGTDDVVLGEWHHAAVSWDGTTVRSYLDGVLQASSNVSMGSCGGSFRLAMNLPGPAYYLDGELDEVRVWETSLNIDDIREWLCRSLTSQHDSIDALKAYYRFDQGNANELTDIVGGFDGVLSGMDSAAAWVASGAALGDTSVYTYAGADLSLQHAGGDQLELLNYNGTLAGIHLYLMEGAPNFQKFNGVKEFEQDYEFGVFKVGPAATTYDVRYTYGNSTLLAGSSVEAFVGLARRHNESEEEWNSQWFEGKTNTSNNTVYLPGQTGTMYAGIVAANNALNFDGTNDHVLTPTANNVNGEFTAEAWVKFSDVAATRTIMSTSAAAATNGWSLSVLGNEQVEFRIGTSSGWLTVNNGSALDTAWHHVAAVYDGDSSIFLYVDGSLAGSRSDVINYVYDGSNPLILGRLANSTNYFEGSMDELRIWTREVCAIEIQDHLGCQFDTSQVGLNTYFSFNQGVANDSNLLLDSLIDQSGNFYNGTLQSFALTDSVSNWVTGSYGISGVCSPGSYAKLIVLSEGDTIFHIDTIPAQADSTDFGNVIVDQQFEVTYELHNFGGDTLFINGVSFAGPEAGFFNAIYPAYVLAGGTNTLRVQVVATASGSLQSDMHINSTDCDVSPYTIRLVGDAYDRAGALDFDGTNDFVSIPYAAANNISSGWTIEAWINPDVVAGTYFPIVAKDDFPNPPSLWIGFGRAEVWLGAATAALRSTSDLSIDTWVHLAATYDQGLVKLYVNGVLDTMAVYGGAVATSTNPYFLGYGELSYFFDGEMDEVRIWGRPRTAAEIAGTMHCELDGDECDLIHYYNFNHPSALSFGTNTGLNVLGDSALNGGNGTLNNFALNDTTSNWTAQVDSVSGDCSSSGDIIPPIVLPYDSVTVTLSGFSAVLLPSSVDSASCDYYSGIDSMWVSPATVVCGMDGDTGYLFVQDSTGLIDSAWFILSVIDVAPPVLAPVAISTVALDPTGVGSILSSAVDSATTDNCQVNSFWLSDSTFDCTDLGSNTVWFYANDTNGNFDSVSVIIDVIDTILPTVVVINPIVLYLDNGGSISIDTTDVNNGSSDGCGIFSMALSQSTFSCADTASTQTVWLYVTDNAGNVDSASTQITVLDTISPVVNAANFTAVLDATGNYVLDTTDVNVNSWDNCAIANMTLSQTNFSCADTSAVQNVTLTVYDVSGNQSSTVVQVTVVDNTAPTVVATDTTIYLDATGNAIIDTSFVHVSSSDNCAINNVWLSRTNFNCADVLSTPTIWLYASDVSGNVDS
ncbi:MAG: LamG domain-containing protein, partial [Cryomorphaceae bacterium]